MTQVLTLPVSSIVVDPDRFREATGDMEGLATSLLRFGQLQPIVVDENNHLIAGLRRLTAHQMNGMATILAVYRDDMDELMKKEIELEENIQREQMTWQERNKAVAQLDAIKRKRDPNWTQAQTAAAAGLGGQNRVSDAIKLENAMKLFPELAKAKDVTQALSWLKTKATQIGRVIEVKNSPETFASIEERIWLGDSCELILKVPDESFHAIITDPPFGLDYDKRTAGSEGSTLNSYTDDADSYRRILAMAPEMFRTLKPSGWVVFFYGMSWHTEVQTVFTKAGFTVDPLPVIWDRSDGRTFTNRPDHYFNRGYDVALFGFKGDPKIAVTGGTNVLRIPPVTAAEREFLVERPIELYAELIRRLTIRGETVADFFAGSGSCPAAAASLERNFFACELNPERRAGAIQKINAHTPRKV